MMMKLLLIFSAFILCVVCSAEETKEKLPMRIEQMLMLEKSGQVRLLKEWPEDKSGLFQYFKFQVSHVVNTEKDHLKAISTIPKRLMEGRVVGKTIEIDGRFYTSIEDEGWDGKNPMWMSVIATKKGDDFLFFSATW